MAFTSRLALSLPSQSFCSCQRTGARNLRILCARAIVEEYILFLLAFFTEPTIYSTISTQYITDLILLSSLLPSAFHASSFIRTPLFPTSSFLFVHHTHAPLSHMRARADCNQPACRWIRRIATLFLRLTARQRCVFCGLSFLKWCVCVCVCVCVCTSLHGTCGHVGIFASKNLLTFSIIPLLAVVAPF